MIFRDCDANIARRFAGCGCTSLCLSLPRMCATVCARSVLTSPPPVAYFPSPPRPIGLSNRGRGEGQCSAASKLVAMASFKGFDDDDEGPISNGLYPELDENPEAKAIGIYKERRAAKVSQTGGRTNHYQTSFGGVDFTIPSLSARQECKKQEQRGRSQRGSPLYASDNGGAQPAREEPRHHREYQGDPERGRGRG